MKRFGPGAYERLRSLGARLTGRSAISATLVVAKADWLVTGDLALLALADKYPITTPAEFAGSLLTD
jgi:hypothetical protein